MDKNYIPTCSVIGAGAGAIYAFRHPSEKVCAKISKIGPDFAQTMKDYKDSFKMVNALDAFKKGEITKEEYNYLTQLHGAICNTYKKEQKVIDILNTPIAERTETYRSAVKKANASRPKLWKQIIKFNKDMQDKYAEIGIFDKEKFAQTLEAAGKKLKLMYKEISKRTVLGLVIGAVIGSAVGYYLNRISNKSK